MKIRNVSACDAEQIANIRRQDRVREELLALTSERSDEVVLFINSLNEYDRAFVAEKNGNVIGAIFLLASCTEKRKHSATIEIMVDEKFHRQGIGSALLKKAIEDADKVLEIHRLELLVLTENKTAISLYEKHGFVIEATRKKSAVKNGVYVDEFMMARIRQEAGLNAD